MFADREKTGLSDNLYSDTKKMHMVKNWIINPRTDAVHPNGIDSGDNTGYRVMPGRKKGIFS